MAVYRSIMVISLIASGPLDGTTNDLEKQAIAELTKLGAKVQFRTPAADSEAKDQKTEPELWFVFIDNNWKGGDEGLAQIEQLPKLPTLYLTGRPKISEERLAKLKKTLPDLKIEYRTKAMLGISTSSFRPVVGCLIGSVKVDSPAAKAGLAEGDVIQQFDGRPVSSFDDLVKELSRKEPDDEVNLTVLRDDMSITVKVKLAKWQ